MGRCRVVVPEVVRLPLSDGDWVDVKKRLTYGERNRMKAALVSEIRGDGRVTPDLQMIDLALVLAYLVDWSLVDFKGKQIPIDTDTKKRAAVEALDEDTVKEIIAAIEAHGQEMDAARSAEKNALAGETASSGISPSVG